MGRRWVGVLGLGGLVGLAPTAAQAQQILVESTGLSFATLQEAVDGAAADDTLVFDAGIHSTASVFIEEDLTLEGGGLATLSSSGIQQILDLGPGVALTVSGLTFTSASTNQRAISASDGGNVLIVTDSVFDTQVTATNTDGGALKIFDPLLVSLERVTFLGEGLDARDGGAIFVNGFTSAPVTLTDVTFDGVGAGSDGGAIYADNVELVCEGCVFDAPNAGNGAGIYAVTGEVTVSGSRFCGATGSIGGGIWSSADTTVTNSVFSNQLGSLAPGSGLYATGGAWSVVNNHFLDNDGLGAVQAISVTSLDVRNNLFLDNTVAINAPSLGVADYNWFDGNTTANTGGIGLSLGNVTGAGDPLLVDTNCLTGELSPTPYVSPLIDAGDPALADPDGSLSDIGAFGGAGADPSLHADDDNDGFSYLRECLDTDVDVNPDADEVCNGGVDDDCSGDADDDDLGVTDQAGWYPDCDGDGEGNIDIRRQSCVAPTEDVCVGVTIWLSDQVEGDLAWADCDDGNSQINTAADELCDVIDWNCDGDAFANAADETLFFWTTTATALV